MLGDKAYKPRPAVTKNMWVEEEEDEDDADEKAEVLIMALRPRRAMRALLPRDVTTVRETLFVHIVGFNWY